jgi:lysophospholipase L1-like esterase/predicted esterase
MINLTLSFLLSTLVSQNPAPQSDYIKDEVSVKGETYPYLLLPPKNIEEGKTYPLIVFLHGAGERGDDNEKQKRHFPEVVAKGKYEAVHATFVLAVQCPEKEWWVDVNWSSAKSTAYKSTATLPMQGAIAALKRVVAEYPIDHESISLTGLSMGGYGAWDLAMRHPHWFSAAIPICGGADENNVARLAGLKLQVWHGEDDGTVPVLRSQVVVEAISDIGMEVDYFELPDTRHNSWYEAYRRKEFSNLLLSAKRDFKQMQVATTQLLARSMLKDERIAFFGDSITQAGNAEGGYVDLIRRTLKSESSSAVIIPAGISGHKVPDLLKRLDKDVIDKKPTVVFIYIGINDVWHSQSGSGTDIKAYGEGLRKIIRSIHKSGSKVVLATPTVIGEKANGENPLDKMLDEYAAVSRKIAKQEKAVLCDLRAVFVDYLDVFNPQGLDKGILTADGVHLNKTGNLLVAIESARAIRQAILEQNAKGR